jgi:hypothetical protein
MRIRTTAAGIALAGAAALGIGACGGGGAPKPAPTVTEILGPANIGNSELYTNIWSNGTRTQCQIFPTVTGSVQRGNCVPGDTP